jgi:alkyldihydroxyacetonephosphate synthase
MPASLEATCTTDKYDRLYHTYGASTVDVAYSVRGEFKNPPDAVAYPRTEDDIVKLFRWCEDNSLAAIPYGGGTSVVGGVNPPEGFVMCGRRPLIKDSFAVLRGSWVRSCLRPGCAG